MKSLQTAAKKLHPLQPVAMAVAVYMLQAQMVLAQETVSGAILPDVTVSASGLGLSADEMAVPVSVLDGQLWQMQRGASLGDSLDGEPGIHATHFGAGASRPIIRGMDGPRVGVLANGVELHDASTISPDHAVTSEPLLAKQVEILRGPSALVHGGAVGGVVNVVDEKVPTQRPQKTVEGSAQVQWGSAANEKSGALGLTTAAGPLVLRVEAAGRNASDYRVGGDWRSEQGGRKVPGSFSDGNTSSVGLSWVGRDAYLGAAYTRQRAQYGIPGHEHADCHLHGISHIHCGTHGHHHHDHDHDHEHEHEHHHGVPEVDMTSHRWDLRGEWRNPWAGVEALRLKGSHTRYSHDELEEGEVATAFRNRAHDLRFELHHAPIAGWRGVLGVSNGQRNFSAQGEEQYVPATRTQKQGLFLLEEYQWADWRLQAALRHDRQSVRVQADGVERKHNGTSASLGAVWKFQPGWQATASFSHAVRMPTAEELFADGMHMATSTWEIGNSNLQKETSNAWDLGVHKLTGNTTWSANFYHYRVNSYIYGRTVHRDEGMQLQHYTQADAKFTGVEGQVRQRINRHMGVSVFGDLVRAKLVSGGNLPRIPAARLGLRVDGSWQGWEGMAEWVQVAHQSKTAAYEDSTGGYGMLNLSASYRFPGTPLQFMLKAENLTDRLAYAHTSAIKRAAPLKGRNITVGLQMDF
ncbi:MAG TPA: TonB-dependent receptor [Comamonas sp.]